MESPSQQPRAEVDTLVIQPHPSNPPQPNPARPPLEPQTFTDSNPVTLPPSNTPQTARAVPSPLHSPRLNGSSRPKTCTGHPHTHRHHHRHHDHRSHQHDNRIPSSAAGDGAGTSIIAIRASVYVRVSHAEACDASASLLSCARCGPVLEEALERLRVSRGRTGAEESGSGSRSGSSVACESDESIEEVRAVGQVGAGGGSAVTGGRDGDGGRDGRDTLGSTQFYGAPALEDGRSANADGEHGQGEAEGGEQAHLNEHGDANVILESRPGILFGGPLDGEAEDTQPFIMIHGRRFYQYGRTLHLQLEETTETQFHWRLGQEAKDGEAMQSLGHDGHLAGETRIGATGRRAREGEVEGTEDPMFTVNGEPWVPHYTAPMLHPLEFGYDPELTELRNSASQKHHTRSEHTILYERRGVEAGDGETSPIFPSNACWIGENGSRFLMARGQEGDGGIVLGDGVTVNGQLYNLIASFGSGPGEEGEDTEAREIFENPENWMPPRN